MVGTTQTILCYGDSTLYDITVTRPATSKPLLRPLINQQILQRQSFRQYEVSDVVTPDGEALQGDGIPVLYSHLDSLEVGVHGDINPRDGAMHLGSILQLNRHSLVRKFHQETDQLHFDFLYLL